MVLKKGKVCQIWVLVKSWSQDVQILHEGPLCAEYIFKAHSDNLRPPTNLSQSSSLLNFYLTNNILVEPFHRTSFS